LMQTLKTQGQLSPGHLKLTGIDGSILVSQTSPTGLAGFCSHLHCPSDKWQADITRILLLAEVSHLWLGWVLWAFTSNGLSCPPAEFLEESFLHAASDALVEGGILAINVVSRAAAPHVTSVEVLRKVCQFSSILFVLNCYTRLMRKILIPVGGVVYSITQSLCSVLLQ
jgi:hypothetical protein